nr:hypothetical protein [Clostridia bacterium]
MGISFSFRITNDSGEEKTYEEYCNDKMDRIRGIISKLEVIKDELDELISEEESFRDELPEKLEDSELYEQSEDISSNLEDAASELDNSIFSLNNIL